jgi:hypothetical protein
MQLLRGIAAGSLVQRETEPRPAPCRRRRGRLTAARAIFRSLACQRVVRALAASPTTKNHHAKKNGPDLAGGLGLRPGPCSLGKSKSRISTSVCIVTASPCATHAHLHIAQSDRRIAGRLQKATMTPIMAGSSGWGLWGEVGLADLAAPAPSAHPGAGADACRVPVKPTRHRESSMRCATPASR